MNIDLRTGGPHAPAYTQEVGDALAEAVRVLNCASSGNAGGLEYPGDVYTLLGALYTATQRLPQLFGQMSALLEGWQASGQLGDSNGLDPNLVTMAASQNLTEAGRLALMVTDSLQAAQNAIAGLYVAEGKIGTEGSGGNG